MPLWRVKVASRKTSMAVAFFFAAISTVPLPIIKSSTYRPSRNSLTNSGCWLSHERRCWLMIPPRRNGEHVRPKRARVKRSTKVSRQGLQWNLRASLSSSFIRICRNAFLRSPARSTGCDLALTRMSHSRFCSGGPGWRQSFRDGSLIFSLAEASYTIWSLVLSASFLLTPLCGM